MKLYARAVDPATIPGHDLIVVQIDNIQTWDCPDFCDAFISYAEIDDPRTGERRELSKQELEDLDHAAYVQEYIWDYIS
tara:strand:+ start:470 stop:706 length:237 start_codon:yes stop_codon:yes gene_type:complete